MLDRVLIFSVFVVASCGLAYELVSASLASYLLGDSVFQFSSIIGAYLFAMGVGSHLSRYVRDEDAIRRFVEIELAVGLIGGVSVSLLFTLFTYQTAPFRAALYAVVIAIGVLVGTEIPLVMRVLHARQVRFGDLVARVLTFDYLGALFVSLLFPLVLAPRLGLARTAAVFGVLNAAVGLYTLHAFKREIDARWPLVLRATFVLALLVALLASAERWTRRAEKELFGDEIVHAETTPYQRLVITRWHDDLRLHINGNLQFSSRDEHRYHEALVHPALASLPGAKRVLVLGGGDGLALREILRYANVEHVTLVDLDPRMTTLFSTEPDLVALNANAFHDPRVHVVNDDAGRWLERNDEVFDLAIVDFPDPSNFALGKLYSVPIYRLLAKHVNARGFVVVQSTSPYYAPHAYWSVDATLREAGFRTWPYHVYVPSFGEWGFMLASVAGRFEPPRAYRLPMRYLDAQTTAQMFVFAPDMPRPDVSANHLNDQALVDYFERDWRNVIR